MLTETKLICNKCGKTIDPDDGHIVQGNIYIIKKDLNERAGIVGNCFPEPDEDGNIRPEYIQERAYHTKCLSEILNMEHIKPYMSPTVYRNITNE